MWVPLESLRKVSKEKLLCKCKCGRERLVRVSDILNNGSKCCRSCSIKLRMLAVPQQERIINAKKASLAAATAIKNRVDIYKQKYGVQHVKCVSHIMAGAKQRCINPKGLAYTNYGGRGISFMFVSVRAAAEWVLDNLGTRPSSTHSIDRIDNNRHYEAGNLRWATRDEQARNKRMYRRTSKGERIRNLKEQRPDLTYETLRTWIKRDLSDDEILSRRKYARSSV